MFLWPSLLSDAFWHSNTSSSNMDTQRGNHQIYGFHTRNPSWIWIGCIQHAFCIKQFHFNSCKFCASSDQRGQCPANHKQCTKCNRKGHFARCCHSRKSVEQIKYILPHLTDSNPDQSKFCLDTINAKNPHHEPRFSNQPPTFSIYSFNSDRKVWTTNLDTNVSMVDFKINSGMEINVLSETIYKKLDQHPKLKSTSFTLTSDNTNIPNLRKCIVSVILKNAISSFMFIIVYTNSQIALEISTNQAGF